jgi:hypothetical protein
MTERPMNDVQALARSCLEDPKFKAWLIRDLKAGRLPKGIRRLLEQYATGGNAEGRAYARGILTKAGVTWEHAE